MPSGAKKRKAAKKKKESQPNNHSIPSPASTHPHGDEDVKHQQDKDSDAGGVSSPASQDHHSHQNILTEGEEAELEKQRSLSNPPPEQELKIEGGQKNVVVEENVIEVEREFKTKDESDKKNGSVEQDEATRKSCGGSSGSSSGESSDDENFGMKNNQAAGDVAPVVDLVKISDSSSGKSSEAIHSAPVNKAGDSVENTPSVVESVLNKNDAEKPSSAEDKVGTSTASADAALERKEEEIVQSVMNTATNPNECVTQETGDKLTLPHDAPRPTGVKHKTNSGVTEPSSVPPQGPVQRTSWKSCCGLFEVFSGSST
ncbi:hypothetical protein CDL12_13556 [Handroanthus impetiginosus]|uniref:Uncharacterized protein n=1 Tax=Handroanthus impetiginosus TaxID=429701 RepID=A0A2G9H8I4_9LAMI|nr:hypothetical protein CDL12_13556 [Handroanthus impetiginosus]